MEASDSPRPASDPRKWRINPWHLPWLLAPVAFPLLRWSAPVLPEPVRVALAFGLVVIVPGWLLHLLLMPRARVVLAARISRAFALGVAVVSVLGLVAWFLGGDAGLGPVAPPSEAPEVSLGSLTAVMWAEVALLLVGALLLVTRQMMRGSGRPKRDARNRKNARVSSPKVAPGAAFAPDDPPGADTAVAPDSGETRPAPKGTSPRGLPSGELPFFKRESTNPVMRRILREAYRLGDQHKADHPIAPRWATLLVLGVIVLTASILGFYAGSSFGFGTDVLDHLSCIREMIERDRVLPRTTFYIDGDGAAVDARKGFFHVVLALVTLLAGVDPARAWGLISGMLMPFALIVFHTFARRLLRSEGSALFATFLALICFGEVTRGPFVRLGYGSKMGTVLSWASLAIVLEYVMAKCSQRTLWVLACAAFAAAATHAFAAVEILFPLGVFLVVLVIVRGPHYPPLRRLGAGLLAALAGCLPILIWRVLFTLDSLNPIHTHRQGVLYFGEKLFIILPEEWGRLLLGVGFGGILLSLFLWKRARRNDAVLYLVALCIAPLLIVANPLIVPLLEPVMGYLVARFVLMVPALIVLAHMARLMGEHLLELNSARRVVTSLLFYVLMLVLLFPRLEGFAHSYSAASLEKRDARSALAWQDLMGALDAEIPVPAVVLSDPLTSYGIPAFTRHYTVSVLHQHGSPSDSLALDRLAACRDVLSPYLGTGEKARHCRRFKVDYALVHLWPERHDQYFCNVGPDLAIRQKEALEQEESLFQKVWELEGRAALFRVRRENLDALAGIVTPGGARPHGRTTEQLIRPLLVGEPPAAALPVDSDSTAGITLVAARLDTTLAGPGEWIDLTLYWRRTGPVSEFPVDVHVRLETQPPRGRFWSTRLSKLHRAQHQKKSGKVYLARWVHTPLQGMLGTEHWPTDRYVVDHVSLKIPPKAASGEYEVKVTWMESTFLPNVFLSHYLSDRDAYDGQTVGRLEVF